MIPFSSTTGGRSSSGIPDFCQTPHLGAPYVPIPYPNSNSTAIAFPVSGFAKKIYKIEGGKMKRLPLMTKNAKTFMIQGDEAVVLSDVPVFTQPSAKRIVARLIGADASAEVISFDDMRKEPYKFYVTPQSAHMFPK